MKSCHNKERHYPKQKEKAGKITSKLQRSQWELSAFSQRALDISDELTKELYYDTGSQCV